MQGYINYASVCGQYLWYHMDPYKLSAFLSIVAIAYFIGVFAGVKFWRTKKVKPAPASKLKLNRNVSI